MPKSPVVILREEARKRGVEVLDIYSFKEVDLVRARVGNKVIVAESAKKVSTLTTKDEVVKFVEDLLKKLA
ncbi:hypothetical protein WLZ34_00920 [Thermogladius sp. KZ2Tp1]|uniref:hypothetical protein n=1 Tax=Thermogladius sp. KZ2Tp1 TaxID=3136289 RepID=UPI003DA9DC47